MKLFVKANNPGRSPRRRDHTLKKTGHFVEVCDIWATTMSSLPSANVSEPSKPSSRVK